jgi:hypothetical protein
MPVVTGVSRAWRASVLAALAASTHKAAFYTPAASLDKGAASLVYTATGECSGTGYTAGGFVVVPTVDNSQDPPFLDIPDLSVSTLTIADFAYIALYDTLAGNRIWSVFSVGGTRQIVNRNIQIVFPTPSANQALLRIYG